jgi:cytochrome c2
MPSYPALIAFVALAIPAAAPAFAGDLAAGEKQFKMKCAVCHAIEPGKNKIGPSLAGIVGRPSGSIQAFTYSAANKTAGLTWDVATLDKYLFDPKALVKGTTMPFPGVKNDGERADLVAYLGTLK